DSTACAKQKKSINYLICIYKYLEYKFFYAGCCTSEIEARASIFKLAVVSNFNGTGWLGLATQGKHSS
ncbi:hypothetical protein KIN13_07595, partial [Vibrio cholerae]